jgi:hypothetical protein
MTRRFLVGAAIVVTLGTWMRPSTATGTDIPYWPSDQAKRLKEVQNHSLDLQRKLFVARMQQHHEEVETLSKQMKTLQDEEVQLLRATGQLPPKAQ